MALWKRAPPPTRPRLVLSRLAQPLPRGAGLSGTPCGASLVLKARGWAHRSPLRSRPGGTGWGMQ